VRYKENFWTAVLLPITIQLSSAKRFYITLIFNPYKLSLHQLASLLGAQISLLPLLVCLFRDILIFPDIWSFDRSQTSSDDPWERKWNKRILWSRAINKNWIHLINHQNYQIWAKTDRYLLEGDIGGSEYRKTAKKIDNYRIIAKEFAKYRKTSKTLSKTNEITKLLPCIILKLRANINLIGFSNIKAC